MNLKSSTRKRKNKKAWGGRRKGAGRKPEAGSIRSLAVQPEPETRPCGIEALGKSWRFGWRKTTVGYRRYIEENLEPDLVRIAEQYNAPFPAGSKRRLSLKNLVYVAQQIGPKRRREALSELIAAKSGERQSSERT